MKTPLIGRRYKIVGELDSGHEGNKIGDIIKCTSFNNDIDYVEFQSVDLYWDGGKLGTPLEDEPSWHYGLVPENIDLHWYDVLELIEE